MSLVTGGAPKEALQPKEPTASQTATIRNYYSARNTPSSITTSIIQNPTSASEAYGSIQAESQVSQPQPETLPNTTQAANTTYSYNGRTFTSENQLLAYVRSENPNSTVSIQGNEVLIENEEVSPSAPFVAGRSGLSRPFAQNETETSTTIPSRPFVAGRENLASPYSQEEFTTVLPPRSLAASRENLPQPSSVTESSYFVFNGRDYTSPLAVEQAIQQEYPNATVSAVRNRRGEITNFDVSQVSSPNFFEQVQEDITSNALVSRVLNVISPATSVISRGFSSAGNYLANFAQGPNNNIGLSYNAGRNLTLSTELFPHFQNIAEGTVGTVSTLLGVTPKNTLLGFRNPNSQANIEYDLGAGFGYGVEVLAGGELFGAAERVIGITRASSGFARIGVRTLLGAGVGTVQSAGEGGNPVEDIALNAVTFGLLPEAPGIIKGVGQIGVASARQILEPLGIESTAAGIYGFGRIASDIISPYASEAISRISSPIAEGASRISNSISNALLNYDIGQIETHFTDLPSMTQVNVSRGIQQVSDTVLIARYRAGIALDLLGNAISETGANVKYGAFYSYDFLSQQFENALPKTYLVQDFKGAFTQLGITTGRTIESVRGTVSEFDQPFRDFLSNFSIIGRGARTVAQPITDIGSDIYQTIQEAGYNIQGLAYSARNASTGFNDFLLNSNLSRIENEFPELPFTTEYQVSSGVRTGLGIDRIGLATGRVIEDTRNSYANFSSNLSDYVDSSRLARFGRRTEFNLQMFGYQAGRVANQSLSYSEYGSRIASYALFGGATGVIFTAASGDRNPSGLGLSALLGGGTGLALGLGFASREPSISQDELLNDLANRYQVQNNAETIRDINSGLGEDRASENPSTIKTSTGTKSQYVLEQSIQRTTPEVYESGVQQTYEELTGQNLAKSSMQGGARLGGDYGYNYRPIVSLIGGEIPTFVKGRNVKGIGGATIGGKVFNVSSQSRLLASANKVGVSTSTNYSTQLISETSTETSIKTDLVNSTDVNSVVSQIYRDLQIQRTQTQQAEELREDTFQEFKLDLGLGATQIFAQEEASDFAPFYPITQQRRRSHKKVSRKRSYKEVRERIPFNRLLGVPDSAIRGFL